MFLPHLGEPDFEELRNLDRNFLPTILDERTSFEFFIFSLLTEAFLILVDLICGEICNALKIVASLCFMDPSLGKKLNIRGGVWYVLFYNTMKELRGHLVNLSKLTEYPFSSFELYLAKSKLTSVLIKMEDSSRVDGCSTCHLCWQSLSLFGLFKLKDDFFPKLNASWWIFLLFSLSEASTSTLS